MHLHLRCQVIWRRLRFGKMHGICEVWAAWLYVNGTLDALGTERRSARRHVLVLTPSPYSFLLLCHVLIIASCSTLSRYI